MASRRAVDCIFRGYRSTSAVVPSCMDIMPLSQIENQLQRFSQQQRVLSAFGQLALQERDLARVMDECVRLLSLTLPVEMAKVLELLPGERSLLLRAGIGWKDGLVGHAVVSAEQDSQAGYTLMVDKPVIVSDLARETRFSGPPLLLDHHVVSGMSCIIRDQEGKPHGVLGVHTSAKRKFGEEDVEFLQTMANMLANAIHRKEIESELESMKNSLERRVEERTEVLLQHQRRIRSLSSELLLTEQRERRRISTELHDYLAQLLVVGKMKISQLPSSGLSEAHALLIKEVEDCLDEGLTYTRDLMAQISPPVLYEFGLIAAVSWLADKMLRHDLQVTVTTAMTDESLRLPESTAVILYQVVRELLLNVVKHARTREAEIVIARDDALEVLAIEVKDSGLGFDPSSVFPSLTQTTQFGLLNTQERIESLGGQFTIHAEPGQGTRVRVAVPFEAEEAIPETIVPTMTPVPREEQETRGGGIRVLLTDDHSIFREGLRTLLNNCADIQVAGEAGNGEEALLLVQSLLPDVVVMDINMPGMNGIEATRLIKEQYPSVYVIGLSMHGEPIVKNAFAEAGGDYYVMKGDSFDSLAPIIRSSQQKRRPG